MSLQTLENLNNIKKKADKVFEEIEAGKDIMVFNDLFHILGC